MEDEDVQDDLCDSPLQVSFYKQAIILTGPAGVCLAMTVEAAEASIERLQFAVTACKRN
jgi:hypothetical protein